MTEDSPKTVNNFRSGKGNGPNVNYKIIVKKINRTCPAPVMILLLETIEALGKCLGSLYIYSCKL